MKSNDNHIELSKDKTRWFVMVDNTPQSVHDKYEEAVKAANQ